MLPESELEREPGMIRQHNYRTRGEKVNKGSEGEAIEIWLCTEAPSAFIEGLHKWLSKI